MLSGVSAAAAVIAAAVAAVAAAAAIVGGNGALVAQGHGREERQREEFVAHIRHKRPSLPGRNGKRLRIDDQGETIGIPGHAGTVGASPAFLAVQDLAYACLEQHVLQ